MPEGDRKDPPLTLDYGRPPAPRRAADYFGAVFGVLTAMSAIFWWAIALPLLYQALFRSDPFFRDIDRFDAGVVVVAALVCSAAAYRWLRQALRRNP